MENAHAGNRNAGWMKETSIMYTEAVGWISAAILALTISRQVYTQWRTRSIGGISRWLFVGQLTASGGFVIYSALVENWIFVFTNFYIFLMAVLGQCIYSRNKRLATTHENMTANNAAP